MAPTLMDWPYSFPIYNTRHGSEAMTKNEERDSYSFDRLGICVVHAVGSFGVQVLAVRSTKDTSRLVLPRYPLTCRLHDR